MTAPSYDYRVSLHGTSGDVGFQMGQTEVAQQRSSTVVNEYVLLQITPHEIDAIKIE